MGYKYPLIYILPMSAENTAARVFELIDICVVHLQGKDMPSTEVIVARRVISKQILLRP
jgi:hypothetical protein